MHRRLSNPPKRLLQRLSVVLILVMGSVPLFAATPDASMAALTLAKHHYKQGNYAEAARLFHQAYVISPRPEFLYNAARAEQRSFRYTEAVRDFKRLLRTKNLAAVIRTKAELHLRESTEALRHYTKSEAAKSPSPSRPTPPAKIKNKSSPRGASKPVVGGLSSKIQPRAARWPAWASFASAAALGVGAGVLYGLAVGREGDLRATLQDVDASDRVTGLTQRDAVVEAASITSQKNLGLGLISAAVLLAGAGGWLWIRSEKPESTAWQLNVGPTHVGLHVRF